MLTVEFASSHCDFIWWEPSLGRIFDRFAYDVETTEIDTSRPDIVPQVVLATAYDGQRGVIIHRDNLLSFFEAHNGVPLVGHNVAYDLAVSQQLFADELDIYQAVENNQVWCTLILHRLLELATTGDSARDKCSLDHCAELYLDCELAKDLQDSKGNQVRLNFGEYLGASSDSIPPEYLRYAARDTMATWELFHHLKTKIRQSLINADQIYGYVSDDWLRGVVARFGPLTHHLQLRASIVLDAINRQGLRVDHERQQEKLAQVTAQIQASLDYLRQAGFVVCGPGSALDLQNKLEEFHQQHPDVQLMRTASDKWSTSAEDLALLAEYDSGFHELSEYRTNVKLKNSYLDKMDRAVVYPRYGNLAATGRTSCRGGFNLQSLPREDDSTEASSIRGCFVPRPGHVFIDSDYSQIELVVLGYIWEHQMGYGDSLLELINSDQDLHRTIAGAVLGKPPDAITKSERAAAKPVSFGRPGGMAASSLKEYAWNSYELDLTLAEVEQRIDAYHQLCPELDRHLEDEVNSGLVLAASLGMTPGEFNRAIGRDDLSDCDQGGPQGWLGGMLLKTLRDRNPVTGNGRPYTAEETDYFWRKAQQLIPMVPEELQTDIRDRVPSNELRTAVRNWAGQRSVFTVTGRLRAEASFCSSRNNLFQGPAADGAICALWQLWRAGFRMVAFVHDQVVVECPDDDRVLEKKSQIEELLIQGMRTVIPGMLVKVETVITRSLDKSDLDPRYVARVASAA